MIKAGILGTSEIAEYYATVIKKTANFELTGCYCPDYDKAKAFASHHELIAYPSAEALFKYIDTLIITDFTPDFLSITSRALKNFKHLFITNPFLASQEEIQHLRKLSEESRVIFQIEGSFRYVDLIPKLESQVSYFAEIHHLMPGLMEGSGTNRLLQTLMQDLYLLFSAIKGRVKKLHTSSWDTQGLNPDILSTRLEFDNGCVAHIFLNRLASQKELNIELHGPEGNQRFRINPEDLEKGKLQFPIVLQELTNFQERINNPDYHDPMGDMIFEAFTLAHAIKTKSSLNITVNAPH